MLKKWKILTEEEIRSLSEADLSDYLSWLKKQKKNVQKDLDKRNIILSKITKVLGEEEVVEAYNKDDEELLKIRKELKNIT